jgi:peptidoglycan/LPS O-acetylase OafA/YrhL
VFGVLLGLSDDKAIECFFEIRPFMLICLIAGFTAYLLTVGRSLTVENAFGITVFLLAMNTVLEFRRPVVLKLLASVGGLSFGIYFIHVLYVEGLQDLFQLLHVAPGVRLDLLVFVLSCLFSVFSMFMCIQILPANVARWIGAI